MLREYALNVLNYFNNLKGYMDYEEMLELVSILSNDRPFRLTTETKDTINAFIEQDKGLEAYLTILEECLLGGNNAKNTRTTEVLLR